jgi:putative aldouronate transport system permease protein
MVDARSIQGGLVVKLTVPERIFNSVNYIVLSFLGLITLYPFWDSFIVSMITVEEYLNSSVHLYPHKISLAAYVYILSLKALWTSYGVTIFVTVVGTAMSLLLTLMAAYALSRTDLKGTRTIMFLIVFTMMFSGGIIPTFLVVKQIGLMNTVWALIIPSVVITYNLIIMRSFLLSIPEELVDSGKIDGCNDVGILFRIVVPISMPSIATIGLFYAVARWNEFFSAVFFISDQNKWPLQLFLRSMLFETEAAYQTGGDSVFLLGVPIKMATLMVATIPIIVVYPFFQKYFVKGATLGALKE